MREGTIKEFVATKLQKKPMSKTQIAELVAKRFAGKQVEAMTRYMGVVFTSLRKEGYKVDVVGQDRAGLNKYVVTARKSR